MPEKIMPKPSPLGCALDKPRNVSDDEGFIITLYYSQIRRKRSK